MQKTVEFGIIKDYPDAVINYEGHGTTGVKITIDVIGDAGGAIRINNTTRGEYLILNTSLISGGLKLYDTITIDTNRGNKTARLLRDGVTSNILRAVDLTSKWPQLQYGNNRFTCTADYGLIYLKVSVSYEARVLGV